MSGKDERRIFDIPICPICGRKPLYWILTDGENDEAPSVGWILSTEYVKVASKYSKHIVVKHRKMRYGFPNFLESIKLVYCTWQMIRTGKHIFEQDSVVFNEVLNSVRYYYNHESYQER